MLNEFDLRAETTAISGYYINAECKCGWHGSQAQLVEKTNSKNRECPTCGAEFTRLKALREPR